MYMFSSSLCHRGIASQHTFTKEHKEMERKEKDKVYLSLVISNDVKMKTIYLTKL